MFTKILIANRGEIACRIIRTARRMGIATVAVYSSADKDSLHVREADEAFYIGEAPASVSYLNIDSIIAVAKQSGAQAIHPGYGFLSENPRFAIACEQEGIIFIGPSVSAMEAMASKQYAKQILEGSDVPLTPGYHGQDQREKTLLQEAKKIGFPVLLKAAAGGGGKGMRSVYEENDFAMALASAKREAKSSFTDDTIIIEKLLLRPRHVEMQIMADNHGNVVHLFERDCSIQRRHQKIIEEAPAPNLSKKLRDGLAAAAIAVAKKIDYRGAGTIEFLVAEEHFYFMEMNTRLQVEHPVTEMITGLDLVEWQIRIAANEPLPLQQHEIVANGHAIECRVYAEDPGNDFLPSIGTIHFLKEPKGESIRIDTGVIEGSAISRFYDPMIAKLIVSGKTRQEAAQKLLQALKQYYIGGVKTNLSFLQAILRHPAFIEGNLSTDFLNKEKLSFTPIATKKALFWAACVEYFSLLQENQDPLWANTFAWQMHLSSSWFYSYRIDEEIFHMEVHPLANNEVVLKLHEETQQYSISKKGEVFYLYSQQESLHLYADRTSSHIHIYSEQGSFTVERFTWEKISESSGAGQLTAPMPSTIVAILKNKGDKIKAGESLVVLEAMKMEHTIHAPQDGLLIDIFYDVGAQVNEGAELVAMEFEQ
ncbi:acyl CoA carboxylase subunit alpha (plasmid) [Legionella adelaidensis]|uniref:Biotin carboxylase n=1 Tax=Legionella adelaidensis TaxID=45056 RepID=A0A0W0R3C3_9GAMM|nr:acetyl-CoA carboxylase biotin carboxylase subunit [Legionella adelaidensis]KTC65574.1 acyl CoA carboxylase subunit alpha [Legionella adelaidensis]VEH85742.1 acyl CoA carboxylase subunit alpha [Legionella adelaidensis]